MKLTGLVLAGVLLGTGAAAAQYIIDGYGVDEILDVAAAHGGATLESQSNGSPRISGDIGGLPYQVFFMNCTEGAGCEDINFYAGFSATRPSLESLNTWNRDKRFGNAYLDTDGDAAIEFDINLEYGVTRENLDAAFALWALMLDQYASYVGYRS